MSNDSELEAVKQRTRELLDEAMIDIFHRLDAYFVDVITYSYGLDKPDLTPEQCAEFRERWCDLPVDKRTIDTLNRIIDVLEAHEAKKSKG